MNPLETMRALWSEPITPSLELPAPQNLAELRIRLQSLALPSFESPPISTLFQSALLASSPPAPPEYVFPEDPLQTLSDRIHGRYEEASDAVPMPEQATSELPTELPSVLDELLGRELMSLVASQDLDARFRAEAVQATTLALLNPSPDNVRAILRALIKGLRV